VCWPLCAYCHSVDAFAWEVIGSVAGVVAAAAAIIALLLRPRQPKDISVPQGQAAAVVTPADTSKELPGTSDRVIGEAVPAGAITDKPVVVGEIPQEPPWFQPRAGLLATLDPPEPAPQPVVRAVIGMSGVGKTQLVAAHARARVNDRWQLVAWVNAEESGSLLAGVAEVSKALGLTERTVSASGDDAGRVVRHWLEADGDHCLIVFDNATDPDALRRFIPAAGAACVLITSNLEPLANLGKMVSVDAFSLDEALAFLAHRTGLADTAGAAAVADELGYLPLALAQAAAVIATQHLSYQTYLDRLQTRPVDEYLTREEGQPYPRGMAEAILLSLEAARADDQWDICTRVMDIMAVLSAAGVRRELLYEAGREGILTGGERRSAVSADLIDRALAHLAARSLLTYSMDRLTISVHRLVIRVIRDGLVSAGRLMAVCQEAAQMLEARAETLDIEKDHQEAREIPEHVTALTANTARLTGEADAVLVLRLLRLGLWAQDCLNELGDSAPQAIAFGEPLTERFEQILGPDDPGTLASRNNLAYAYRETGRIDEAITLYERTLADRERVLGADHLRTLFTRNNLAITYLTAGRVTEAISLEEQVIATWKRLQGDDNRNSLRWRNNLADAYLAAGRVGEAIALHEQTLAARERVLGPSDVDAVKSRNNLANAYREAGRIDQAIPLGERAVADFKQVRGSDHPDTLKSQSNLADAYLAAGRVGEAIALHEQTLAARERVLGPDHPDTLKSRDNLATANRTSGTDQPG
jgi:tetratricopeptide (TPR) repeat protein